jgi:YD repeat-containing protein
MIDPNFDPTAIPLGRICDDDNRLLSYRDETGLWYVYTYDDDGRVLTYREKDKFWYVYTYDGAGRVLTWITSDGRREDYTYDDGKCTITRTHTHTGGGMSTITTEQ